MDYKEFFEQWDSLGRLNQRGFSVETLYEAFKARFIAETATIPRDQWEVVKQLRNTPPKDVL